MSQLKNFLGRLLGLFLWLLPFLGMYLWGKLPEFGGKTEIGCAVLLVFLGISAFLTPKVRRHFGHATNGCLFWAGLLFAVLAVGFYFAAPMIEKKNSEFETVSYVGTVERIQPMGQGRYGKYYLLYMTDGTPILDALEPRLNKTQTCVSKGLEEGKKFKFSLYKTTVGPWVLYRATKCTQTR